ncbi:MAG: YfiR family protein [Magnetococcales bacterium]|nr:YfiR family protein [Magnetococcales bacterium]
MTRAKWAVLLRIALVLLLGDWLWAGGAAADAPHPPSEPQVKVAYLYNFTKFVTYPEAVFLGDRNRFNICVLGENPFGDLLNFLAGKSVQERKIQVHLHTRLEETSGCHLVFIAPSEAEKWVDIMAWFGERPVLLVGDTPGFAQRGGMINFIRVGDTLRFEINLKMANRCGLKISSSMLQIGRVVE